MQMNVSSFDPEIRMSHYIAFICDSCIKVLSTRTFSHLGTMTFSYYLIVLLFTIRESNLKS